METKDKEEQKKMTEEPQKPVPLAAMAPRYPPHELRRYLCATVVVILLLIGITSLIVWLVYRPHKPRFSVQDVAVYQLNRSSISTLATSMQFTILARNPNKRVSIYYDQLSAFVSYRNQAITMPTPLPPFYLGHKSTVFMSPLMGGGFVPISPDVSSGLDMDQAYGIIAMRLVLLGRLRWKAGAFKTAHYGIYVKCDVFMGLKSGFAGQVPLLGSPRCSVDI